MLDSDHILKENAKHFFDGCCLLFPGEYFKIPKISPGAYIFQTPFLRGLYSEGLIYGRKIAFQYRLGLYSEGNVRLKIDWASS